MASAARYVLGIQVEGLHEESARFGIALARRFLALLMPAQHEVVGL
jgi:hypothetical protein